MRDPKLTPKHRVMTAAEGGIRRHAVAHVDGQPLFAESPGGQPLALRFNSCSFLSLISLPMLSLGVSTASTAAKGTETHCRSHAWPPCRACRLRPTPVMLTSVNIQ